MYGQECVVSCFCTVGWCEGLTVSVCAILFKPISEPWYLVKVCGVRDAKNELQENKTKGDRNNLLSHLNESAKK